MFSSRDQKRVQKELTTENNIEGFPITHTEYVPLYMEHAVKHKDFKCGKHPMLKFALTNEGSIIVKLKSLEMIRKKLVTYFNLNPEIQNQLKTPFPRHTLAISFSTMNFEVDQTCNQFKLFPHLKKSESAYFTFQRLTENVQATYFNENGIEFLAGICYYPVLNGMPKNLGVDAKAIQMALAGAIYYPLQDRRKQLNFTKYQLYGRFCESSGKRVVICFNNRKKEIRHKTINFETNKFEYTVCQECADEASSYNFVGPSKTKRAPIVDSGLSYKFPALRLLELAGIGLSELSRLSYVPMDTKIPMTHKATMTILPESERPKLECLVQFVMLNLNWRIDKMFVLELPTSVRGAVAADVINVFNRKTGVMHDKAPKLSELKAWLDANPDYNVHSSSALIARLTLGMEYNNRIGADKTSESPSQTSSEADDNGNQEERTSSTTPPEQAASNQDSMETIPLTSSEDSEDDMFTDDEWEDDEEDFDESF